MVVALAAPRAKTDSCTITFRVSLHTGCRREAERRSDCLIAEAEGCWAMLYKSVSQDQLQQLVKQHVKNCLERIMGDHMSAPTMNHQLLNIAYARLFALIAEDPACWGNDGFAKQLDHLPITTVDRENLAELAA